jgi:Nuclease-related domain
VISVNALSTRRPELTRRPGRAGRAAAARFHEERIKNFRRQWKLWLAFLGLAGLSIVFMALFGRVGVAVGGWMLGFITAVSVFGWMIAFDVHALTWLWGSWGEEDTEQELARLGKEWSIRHDIPNAYGNWDHVAVGPPGVFMIETKRLRGRVEAKGGGLSSGRMHFKSGTFLGASAGLKDAIAAEAGRCPFVQAVVTVWGDFPPEPQEKERVVYLHGARLVDWLEARPVAIDDDWYRVSLARALQRL